MKFETPQLLWHNGSDNDNGKNAPLYSVDVISRESSAEAEADTGSVVATAGNSTEVNLWEVSGENGSGEKGGTRVRHLVSLTRHDRSVNAVRFSPDGLHLASGGDGGSVVIWSVPLSQRRQGGPAVWSCVEKEGDVHCRVVPCRCDDILDLSWDAEGKRLAVCSVDHFVMVLEDCHFGSETVPSDWKCVYNNGTDSAHYVQGVAFDPLGAYLATQASDRAVRLYARPPPPAFKPRKVLAASDTNVEDVRQRLRRAQVKGLSEAKFQLGKAKLVKYRESPPPPEPPTNDAANRCSPPKQYLFADESTVGSFFRRLAWTHDGAFLLCPSGLWHRTSHDTPTFATYLFARHSFDTPSAVLYGMDKPSVAVRPNPLRFKLPVDDEAWKENECVSADAPYRSIFAVLTMDTILIYDTHHCQPLAIVRGLHYAGLTDCSWTPNGRRLLVTSTDGYLSILSFDQGELGQVLVEPQSPPTMSATPSCGLAPWHTVVPPCAPGQVAAIVSPPAKKPKPSLVPPLDEAVVKKCRDRTPDDDDNAGPLSKKKKRIQPWLVSADKET